jgi:hypothetical protein
MKMLAEMINSAEKNSLLIGDFNLPGLDWTTGQKQSE